MKNGGQCVWYSNDHSVHFNSQPTNDSKRTDQTVFYSWADCITRLLARASNTHICIAVAVVQLSTELNVLNALYSLSRIHTHSHRILKYPYTKIGAKRKEKKRQNTYAHKLALPIVCTLWMEKNEKEKKKKRPHSHVALSAALAPTTAAATAAVTATNTTNIQPAEQAASQAPKPTRVCSEQ